MEIRKKAFWISIVLLIVLVPGCTQSTEDTVVSTSEAPLIPVSSVTPVPSFTPLPTNTHIPTLTPTLIPTLTVDDAQVRLLQLLSDNGNCRLPCLWGITPGKSSFQEAQTILVPLSGSSDFTAFISGLGSVTPYLIEGDLQIYTAVDFISNPDNSIVNAIAFNVEAHKPLNEGGYAEIFDSNFFGEKVSAYTLSRVLTEQGVPSSVMIATSGGPLTRGGTGGFDILLLYPDQSILVNYTTQMQLIGENVRGCPQNSHVEMELYPPGNPETFFQFLERTDWAVKKNYYKPLEDVTPMSVEDFYQIFREPTTQCIETPANLWPVPEP